MEFIEGQSVLEVARMGNSQIDQRFTETLVEMNRITPDQVPSLIKRKGMPPQQPSDALCWIDNQLEKIKFPEEFSKALSFLHSETPSDRPRPAFGNGDLNPMNFICRPDGRITVVDWEYAGFNDPIAEIMLLNVWPENEPFLPKHPIDKIYCEMTGISTRVLKWYEMLSTISGWIYAANDHNSRGMVLHEKQLNESMNTKERL
jgi:thiamine kinase-like enzyme